MTTAVTEQSFEQEVLKSDKPVIVDSWAEWCGPCHAVAPVLDKIVAERDGDLKLVKVNIDEQPALSQRFGVQSIHPVRNVRGGALSAKPSASDQPWAAALCEMPSASAMLLTAANV